MQVQGMEARFLMYLTITDQMTMLAPVGVSVVLRTAVPIEPPGREILSPWVVALQ